jgi:hypothetical protein
MLHQMKLCTQMQPHSSSKFQKTENLEIQTHQFNNQINFSFFFSFNFRFKLALFQSKTRERSFPFLCFL